MEKVLVWKYVHVLRVTNMIGFYSLHYTSSSSSSSLTHQQKARKQAADIYRHQYTGAPFTNII